MSAKYTPCSVFSKIAALLWLASVCAQAHTFWIKDFDDSTNTTSLRGAIIAANASHSNTVILLQAGTYKLTLQGPYEDEARTGDLDITRARVVIVGKGTNTIIDASGLGDRAFHVMTNARLSLLKLVITGGRTPVEAVGRDGEPGGGILNSGSLSLRSCVIVGNASGHPVRSLGFQALAATEAPFSTWVLYPYSIAASVRIRARTEIRAVAAERSATRVTLILSVRFWIRTLRVKAGPKAWVTAGLGGGAAQSPIVVGCFSLVPPSETIRLELVLTLVSLTEQFPSAPLAGTAATVEMAAAYTALAF